MRTKRSEPVPMESLTVRDAAGLTGLSAHTLRYYERAGLLAPVSRAPNGHRRYARADLEHLQFLHCLRATGMPIRRMQEFAALAQHGRTTLAERRELLEAHRRDVTTRIEEMQRLCEVIDAKIEFFREHSRAEIDPARSLSRRSGHGTP